MNLKEVNAEKKNTTQKLKKKNTNVIAITGTEKTREYTRRQFYQLGADIYSSRSSKYCCSS